LRFVPLQTPNVQNHNPKCVHDAHLIGVIGI
jgi:hypothetical protein